MQGFLNAVTGIANESGFVGIMENPGYLIMIIVACGLIYPCHRQAVRAAFAFADRFRHAAGEPSVWRDYPHAVFHPAGRRGPFAVSDVQRDPAPWPGWLICCILASSWAFIRR